MESMPLAFFSLKVSRTCATYLDDLPACLLTWRLHLPRLSSSSSPLVFFFFFFSICNSKCSSDLRFIIPMKAETLLPWFLFHFFGFLLSPASCCWLIKADTPHKVWFRRVLDDQEIKFNFIVAAPQ